MALVDAYGRPIIPAELVREKSAPTLTGIRRIWDETVASGLTPQRLATLLRSAAEGDHDAQLTLAEEMEERDLHYACELGKRKLAVGRLPATIEAAADDQKSIDIADACRALIKGPGFTMLKKNMLDGLGKGYSVSEIIWDRSKSRWKPARFEWRDPHFFQFDRTTRREVRLRDESDLVDGLPLTPYGFITHIPVIKSGIPIRGGLARLAAWAFMCKSYAVKDWLAFAEIYGMPLRLGKYGSGASEPDKDVLRMAVANLGVDAAAIFPDSMQIELIERKSTGGDTVFQVLAEYLDAQISKGVLGQSASSSGGADGLGNDKLQSEVRDDIRDDDAEQLEATLQRDLIIPFVDLNFGPQEEYPTLQLREVKKEDLAAYVSAIKELVPLGLKVEQSVVRDKIGIPDPDEKTKAEDLLGGDEAKLYEYHFKYGTITVNEVRARLGLPPVTGGEKLIEVVPAGATSSPLPPPAAAPDPVIAQAANRQQPCACPSCATARNAEDAAPNIFAQMAANLATRADMPMIEWIEQLRQLTQQAESLEALRDSIAGAFPEMSSEALAQILAEESTRATMIGRLDVSDGE